MSRPSDAAAWLRDLEEVAQARDLVPPAPAPKPARSGYPARGIEKAEPLLADLKCPLRVTFIQSEMQTLLHGSRNRTSITLYWLLRVHADFKTGELPVSSYKRWRSLMTPPQPERGPRQKSPALWEVRRALDELIALGLAWRDSDANRLHGQLRLFVRTSDQNSAPTPLLSRKPRRP